jgi:hypothetical protein
MKAAFNAESISFPLSIGIGFGGAKGLKSLGLIALPFFGSLIKFAASAIKDAV